MAELNAISMRLERKVELHSRYRDSLSTVLALRDSQNSLEQNKTSINQNRTIERLTTLTIGYLPLGLTAVRPLAQPFPTILLSQQLTLVDVEGSYADRDHIQAIFAIPEEQFVISKGTGRGWFVGIILILFAATVLVASAIEALKKGYHFCTGWVAWFFHKVHDLVWHAVENYLLIRRPEGGFLRWLFGTVLHIHRAPSPYGDAFGGEPYRDKKTGKGKEKGEKIGKDKVPKHSRWQERNAGEAPARDAGGSNGHALVSGPSGKPDTDLWKRIVESNQRTEVGEAEHGFEQSAVSPLKRLWDVVTCGRREPHEPPGDVEIGGNPKRRNQDPVGR